LLASKQGDEELNRQTAEMLIFELGKNLKDYLPNQNTGNKAIEGSTKPGTNLKSILVPSEEARNNNGAESPQGQINPFDPYKNLIPQND